MIIAFSRPISLHGTSDVGRIRIPIVAVPMGRAASCAKIPACAIDVGAAVRPIRSEKSELRIRPDIGKIVFEYIPEFPFPEPVKQIAGEYRAVG